MKTNKFLMISALAILACSCSEEEQWGGQPTPGEEVKFGASLESTDTRTIYGDEANGAFPIYWVNGDRVQIFSPQCATNDDPDAIGSAVYAVTVEKATQNYATSIDKVGDWGVRWGDNATADFYSVYPATSATVVGQDCKSARLTMTTQQNNTVRVENGVKKVYPDMNNCFMYAATPGANSGADVNLSYKPLSTAVRFNVVGPQTGDAVGIQYARLYAPTGTYLSGSFNVDFTNADTQTGDEMPTVTHVDGRAFNYASMNAAYEGGAYITIEPNETVEFCLYFLLERETEITDDWYIEIATTNNVVLKKNLRPYDAEANRTLIPGQIHRLPNLPALDNAEEWNPANWMENIQRNVYLSEISLPGSWYSLSSEYQGARNSISAQYSAGVRAFHLDTRWIGDYDGGGIFDDPTFDITDLGIAQEEYSETTGLFGGDKYMNSNATTFSNALKQVTDIVKDEEYMVVICTFAQGSLQALDGSDWRQYISNACANNDKVINANELSENSVVGDVLGKVIVIVNTYTPGAVNDSKCFYFNMGMTLNSEDFGEEYYKVPLLKNNSTESGITIYGTHAQITTDGNSYNDNDRGYVPSLTEREGKAQNILNWSRDNYADINNYAHNAWIYIGLGGYIPADGGWGSSDDTETVAQELNNWIGNKVSEMDNNNSYYPIGIVLMNFATNYSQIVNDILQLNTKYRKAYDPNRSPVDGTLVGGISVQSAAPGYSSGMTDSHTNAIGW